MPYRILGTDFSTKSAAHKYVRCAPCRRLERRSCRAQAQRRGRARRDALEEYMRFQRKRTGRDRVTTWVRVVDRSHCHNVLAAVFRSHWDFCDT